jgi:hypothetical protein
VPFTARYRKEVTGGPGRYRAADAGRTLGVLARTRRAARHRAEEHRRTGQADPGTGGGHPCRGYQDAPGRPVRALSTQTPDPGPDCPGSRSGRGARQPAASPVVEKTLAASGVHQDALVHVSALSDRCVKAPRHVVKAGDIVKVKVLEVGMERRRIAFSMRLGDPAARPPKPARGEPAQLPPRGRAQRGKAGRHQAAEAAPPLTAVSRAFAGLTQKP